MTNEELYYLPASELLKHIQAEKERLIKEKVIKKSKGLAPITHEEKPYELPEDWEWVRLGEICKNLNYGYTASATDINTGVKMLRITDVQDNKVNWDTVPFCEISDERLNSYVLNKNDIVIARTGGTVGKSFIIDEIPCIAVFASYLIRIQLFNKINPIYVKHFIESPLYWSQLIDKTTGTGQPNVNATSLAQLILPLPPLYIQDQIVQKLEQLSETKDSLLSHAESQLNYTKKMREALLQEAIRGELVPQDENDEPASILLEQIKAEKERLIKEKVIKKQKELPPITDEEKPYELPEGWEWVRLGNVAQFNPRNKADNDSLVGFIPMTLISDGFANNHTFETRKWEQVKSGYTHFANDDVIFAKITPCFENRKSTIVKDLPNGIGSGTTEVITLRSYNNTILPGYLLALVNSPEFINGGKLTYLGTAGQQRVNAEFLKNYVFALPPLTEQERIVAKLDELMANCDQLEGKAEEMKTYTTRLFEASLKEAFMPDIEEC